MSPRILSFKILEADYAIGSIIHLRWVVENSNIIQINDTDVTSRDEYAMKVDRADTITIITENDYDKVSRSIRLSPKPTPRISTFSASCHEIRSGQETKLKWKVRHADKVIIKTNEEESDATYKSYLKITPSKTTTYTIVDYSCDEAIFVEQDITIKILAAVKINSFTANKDIVAEADKVTLRWDVENATSIIIHPMMRGVIKICHYEVSPSRTSEYKLIASNSLSQDETILSIGVRQLPKVDLQFEKLLPKIEIPTCTVDLSLLSKNLRKSRVDEWLMLKPIEEVEWTTRTVTIVNAIKRIFRLLWRK